MQRQVTRDGAIFVRKVLSKASIEAVIGSGIVEALDYDSEIAVLRAFGLAI